jgi:hypothetical protein
MKSDHDLISLFDHDLFGKPVPTFPHHALGLVVDPQEIVLGQAKAVADGFFPRGDLMVIFGSR